jgi:hypothetical protein
MASRFGPNWMLWACSSLVILLAVVSAGTVVCLYPPRTGADRAVKTIKSQGGTLPGEREEPEQETEELRNEIVNSIGISILIEIIEKMIEKGGRLSFCCLTPVIQKTFQIMGLAQYAAIFPDEESAVRELTL